MSAIPGWRYDGQTSARTPVVLHIGAAGVRIEGLESGPIHYPLDAVELQPRLGGMRPQLRFADGSVCELATDATHDASLDARLDAALAPLSRRRDGLWLHRLERSLPLVLLAVLFTVAFVYALIQYGIPLMAREIAHRMPLEIEARMGDEALEVFDHWFMAESTLDAARRQALEARFQALARSTDAPPVTVLFRRSGDLGANAFALPNGIVVFTDDLVALAEDDRELLGVFAHELGHVQHRHTLRHVLQNSATGLLLILLTGDIGSASSLAATLPTLLVQTKFSREFESEADDYAIALLARHGIGSDHLGNLLARMEAHAGGDNMPGFLSTHPATDDRVRKFTGHVR